MEIIITIVSVSIFAYALYLMDKEDKRQKTMAKENVEKFNRTYEMDYTINEFCKVYRRNPDWFSMSVEKQFEALSKHGLPTLMFSCVL